MCTMFSVHVASLRNLCRYFSSLPRKELIAPLQEAALEEKCILVDDHDVAMGAATKRECHKVQKDGSLLLHRAFSVFLFNTKGEMLVQKRSAEKITFPNHVTNACCSHPLSTPRETVEDDAVGVKVAALRRLNYELGIPLTDARLEDLKYLTRIQYQATDKNQMWGEHEIDYILFLVKDVHLNVNEHEVSHVQYVAQKDFDKFLSGIKEPLTPWFKLVIQHYLHDWWSNLHNLQKYHNHSKIFKL